MKLKLFTLIFASTFLLACDSATLSGADSGITDIDTDLDSDADAGTDTDSDADTDNNGSGIEGGGVLVTDLNGVTTSGTTEGIVNSVGLIKLEPLGVTVDRTRGLFGALPESLTEQQVREWYIPSTDSCIVTLASEDEAKEATDEFVVLDQITNLISAGESLILTDDYGTYATLKRIAGLSGPAYVPETDLDQAAGTNLLIDIPGDEFAAFPGIAVPEAPALEVVSPASGETANVSTFFQWQPNEVAGSIIELYIGGFSSVAGEDIAIGCSLVDDGLFGLPEDVQAQMGPDFQGAYTTMLRIGYNVAADGDAMVFVANSVRAE